MTAQKFHVRFWRINFWKIALCHGNAIEYSNRIRQNLSFPVLSQREFICYQVPQREKNSPSPSFLASPRNIWQRFAKISVFPRRIILI